MPKLRDVFPFCGFFYRFLFGEDVDLAVDAVVA